MLWLGCFVFNIVGVAVEVALMISGIAPAVMGIPGAIVCAGCAVYSLAMAVKE